MRTKLDFLLLQRLFADVESGNNVYNRRSFKLKKKHVDNPSEM